MDEESKKELEELRQAKRKREHLQAHQVKRFQSLLMAEEKEYDFLVKKIKSGSDLEEGQRMWEIRRLRRDRLTEKESIELAELKRAVELWVPISRDQTKRMNFLQEMANGEINKDASPQSGSLEVYQLLQFFTYSHLPDHLQAISKPFRELAEMVLLQLPYNVESEAFLRKLLEAKDCAVRAKLLKL